jgi:hypothetical protein
MAGNQITELLDPAQMPNQDMDQQTFDNLWAAVLRALPNWGAQANALAANLNSIAAGGAYAIPYTFTTGAITATTGKLSVDNSAAQGASGHLYLNKTIAGGTSVDAVLETFDDSTSAVKGQIRLVKASDPTKWLIFNLASVVSYANYKDCIATVFAASSTNPFVEGDLVLLSFQRTGDKGDTGSVASFPYIYVRDEKPNGTGGGVATNGATIRTLNTVKANTISGASLSANTVTLPAGTYEYVGSVPGMGVNAFQAELWNVTDIARIDVGTSEYATSAGSVPSRSFVRGVFTISASKSIQLRHLQVNGASGTFGTAAANANSVVEVYSELWIKKVA